MTKVLLASKSCARLLMVLTLAATMVTSGCANDHEVSGLGVREIYYRDSVVALMYHHLAEPEGASTISPQRFAAQLAMLEAEGFVVIPLPRLASFLKGKNKVPANAVVLTFDDGYASAYEVAYPLLKERGWPAAVFVIVSQVGLPGREGSISKLSWDQVQQMHADGFNFYSHTYDSHRYVRVTANGATKPALAGTALRSEFDPAAPAVRETEEEYMERVRRDLSLAREVLQRELGDAGEFLAAPYGWAGDGALKVARELGHRYNFTVKPGLITPRSSPLKLARINAGSPGLDAQQLKAAILAAVKEPVKETN